MTPRSIVRALGPAACAAALLAGSGARADTAYGLTTSGVFMVRFDTAAPEALEDVVAISGLQVGERLAAIDFRPRTGQLYGIGVRPNGDDATVRTYVVDPETGRAELVTSGTPFTVLESSAYGMAFDPVADVIRVVTLDFDDNFRVDPDSGARADVPVNDTNLMSAQVSAAAYDRSFHGTAATSAFALQVGTGELVTIGGVDGVPSPNGGTLMNPLSMGAPASGDAGFDIGPDDDAFAALQFGGVNTLYEVDLETGLAASIGPIGGGNLSIGGLALAPKTVIAVGAEKGSEPRVRLLDAATGNDLVAPFLAFDGAQKAGVRVTAGDLNGDGVPT